MASFQTNERELGQRKEKQTVSREQEIRVERGFEHQRPSKHSQLKKK